MSLTQGRFLAIRRCERLRQSAEPGAYAACNRCFACLMIEDFALAELVDFRPEANEMPQLLINRPTLPLPHHQKSVSPGATGG
jgi:hypothetical protein